MALKPVLNNPLLNDVLLPLLFSSPRKKVLVDVWICILHKLRMHREF